MTATNQPRLPPSPASPAFKFKKKYWEQTKCIQNHCCGLPRYSHGSPLRANEKTAEWDTGSFRVPPNVGCQEHSQTTQADFQCCLWSGLCISLQSYLWVLCWIKCLPFCGCISWLSWFGSGYSFQQLYSSGGNSIFTWQNPVYPLQCWFKGHLLDKLPFPASGNMLCFFWTPPGCYLYSFYGTGTSYFV